MRPRQFAAVLLGATLLGVCYALFAWMQKPISYSPLGLGHASVASVANGPAKTSSLTSGQLEPAVIPDEVWDTSYFMSKIPSSLRIQTSREDDSLPMMASYVLTPTAIRQPSQISVSVGTLNNTILSEVSAVKLRLSQASVYSRKAEGVMYAPADALVFSRADSYETAIFWEHQGRYVAVVASGTATDQQRLDTDKSLAVIVKNWQWK